MLRHSPEIPQLSQRQRQRRLLNARDLTLAVLFPLLLLLAACSSGTNGQVVESTETTGPSTVQATMTPTTAPTVTPATASATPTPGQSGGTTVSYPACNSSGTGGGSSLGTAPAPTPTPAPTIGSRDPAVVSRDISDYMSATQPIVQYLSRSSAAFNEKWSTGLSTDEQARLLKMLGSRAAISCGAAALITDVPLEAAGFNALLREGARIRHAWVGAAADQLSCCGTSVNPDTASGNTLTSATLAELVSEIESLLAEYDAALTGGRSLRDDALGIEITVEEGWLVSSEGLSPVLYAPFELNGDGVVGLGPDSWQLGAAVRVRRLRNPAPLTAAEASSRFAGLISRHGSVESVVEIEVDSHPGLRHVLIANLPSWSASVTVFVAGDFTYFIESGCPADVPGACASIDAVAASLRLIP